jgi:hypothetical protein
MANVTQPTVDEPKPPNANAEPTLTHFQQLAAQLKTAIGAVMAEIPEFDLGHDESTRSVSAHQSIPTAFIGTVSASVDPKQVGKNVFDPADAQNVLQFVEAFRPLVDDAAALASSLDHTVKAQYARVAAGALNAYAIMKRLARKGDAAVKLHVQNMQRDLGRTRVRPRFKTPTTPPQTTP